MRIASILLLALIATASDACAQEEGDRQYLNEVLAASDKRTAKYYRILAGQEGELFLGKTFSTDGKLKAEGSYLDAALSIPHGAFVFYHSNGKVESRGAYRNGNKSGVWERFDAWGQPLAEKIYDPEPLANIVYTRAQTMPQYAQGGERGFIKYVRESVAPIIAKGESGSVTTSFIVEKNGELTDVKVIEGKGGEIDGRIVEAVKATSPWQPGAEKGQPVRVQMRVPVQF